MIRPHILFSENPTEPSMPEFTVTLKNAQEFLIGFLSLVGNATHLHSEVDSDQNYMIIQSVCVGNKTYHARVDAQIVGFLYLAQQISPVIHRSGSKIIIDCFVLTIVGGTSHKQLVLEPA